MGGGEYIPSSPLTVHATTWGSGRWEGLSGFVGFPQKYARCTEM